MRDRDPHLGHALVEKLLRTRQILDARADIEGLPAAIALAQQRLAHHSGSNGATKVRTASRSTGGEAMIDRSRTRSAQLQVRGIGVAVR